MGVGRDNKLGPGSDGPRDGASSIACCPSPLDYSPRLHGFAVAFVVATFGLVVMGGMVTSKGVGLAVPDWPTTYHYNMFLFPPSLWKGGIFYEHVHRLLGSLIGMLAIVMAAWLWLGQPRRWLRWLGMASLALVIVQGVMGGLRVTEVSTSLAVLHGVTAQLFLCMTVLIAAATSRLWITCAAARPRGVTPPGRGVRRLSLLLLLVVVVQLFLGATTRHTGAGLAIPDFPTAYGRIIPPFDQQGISRAINGIPYDRAPTYYSPAQVGVHFAHRLGALAVVAVAMWAIACTSLAFPGEESLRRPMVALACLLIAQVALGVLVIWTGRHAEVATAHQAIGAATLATATLLAIRVHLLTPLLTASPDASARRPGDVLPHVGVDNGAAVIGWREAKA